jgi:hypothetical protein
LSSKFHKLFHLLRGIHKLSAFSSQLSAKPFSTAFTRRLQADS